MWIKMLLKRRPKTVISLAAAVVIAVAGLAMWLVFQQSPSLPLTGQTQLPASAAPTLPPPLTEAEAQQLAVDIASGDAVRVRSAIAIPSDQQLDPKAVTSLASLRIAIDVSTFVTGSGRLATATGTVTDANGLTKPATFYLIESGGRWMLADAVPRK